MADFIMRNMPGVAPGRSSSPGGPASPTPGRSHGSSRATHDPSANKPQAPPPEVVNSSTDAPVFRGDGIQLFGLDAELELKARAKRDPNVERYVEEWIEGLTGEQLAPKGDLSESLKNGVMMCKLVNVIHPNIVKSINMRPIALMEMENIGFYLKACWTLGVPSGELFVTSDLYLKKAKENLKDKPALACLPPLKAVDPNAPVAEPRARPMLQKSATDSRLASRWNKVASGEKVTDAPASPDSLEADPEYVSSGLMADQLNALKKRLERELAEKAELKKSKQTLEEQLMKLQMQRPADASETEQKQEAETRKALATAEFASLQQELHQLRDKNARKSIMLKDSVSRQEVMQRQLEEKSKLEEEVKKLRTLEDELKTAKAKGEVAENLEKEVKDLREKNYRKSIMLRETVSSQAQLQAQLNNEKASLEDEVRRLRALEGEVEQLRMQGKDAASHEQEVRQLREELKEKYLLEQEVKKLRSLEGEISRMKGQGQDTTGLEVAAKQQRDSANRRSILIQQKHSSSTVGGTAKVGRSNTSLVPTTRPAAPQPAAKEDMSWMSMSDQHLAKAQADIDEETKKIKQLTQQAEQLRVERREAAAAQVNTELTQLTARHQRKVRMHQKEVTDRQEYDNGRQALESIEREIAKARAEGGEVREMEEELRQLRDSNDKKGSLIREALQRIAQLEGLQADKLPPPPTAMAPPTPTQLSPNMLPVPPAASPRKDIGKGRSTTTTSMAILPSDDARTGRSVTSTASGNAGDLEVQIKQLREQNARKSVALKDAAQMQQLLDKHMKEKEALEKEVNKMKNMEADVKKLRRQGKETDTLEKEVEKLKAVNDKKNEDLKRAESALEKEVSEKSELEAEVQRLKQLEDELIRMRAEDGKAKSAYESELNQLRSNASRKSMALKDAMKQQQSLQTQLADRAALEAEVVSLRQLHGQIEVTKQQYEAQMREAATLQEQLKRQIEEKSALQTEVKKMRALERELNELRSAGKDAQAMEDEIKQLRAAGAQAKSAKDSVALQAELNVLREKEAKNAQAIKGLQQKLADSEEEKSNLEAELATQLETNATQIDQMIEMESSLREAREKAVEAEMLQEEVALLKLELETAAESGGGGAPEVDMSKFESKIASLTEELLKLKEAEIKTQSLEKNIQELESEVIHLRVSAKDAESLEHEVENLRQQVSELQARELSNPYEPEMRAMEEELNKMRKQKEEDDRELFDYRLKCKMQEEQLKKLNKSSSSGDVTGTSPTADPALQAKLTQLQEALMKEKMEKVSVTKQLIDLKTSMSRSRSGSDATSVAQGREIQQLRAVLAREQQDKARYIEMLQQQGLISSGPESAAKQNKTQALEAVLARVLNSKPVEFSDVAKFNDLFKSDAGMLKKQMKETTSLLLSDNSFDILLFIFNTVLQNQDESKSKDFRSCKIVMYASCALGKRGADGKPDFIQYHIQGYDIWRNLGFWEQYFQDEVARKYKEQSPQGAQTDEAATQVAKQFVENLIPVIISSFAHDMIITWKVPADKVREFAANMSAINSLSTQVQEQLKSDVAFYEASLTSPQKRKELEAGLKKKFRASQLFMKTFQSNQLGGPGAAGSHAPVKQPTRAMPVKTLPPTPPGEETRHRHGGTISGPAAPTHLKAPAHVVDDDDDEDDSGMMIGKAKKWKRMSMARVASPSAPPPVRK